LAHAYIAAELNKLSGASMPTPVVTALSSAESLFNQFSPLDILLMKGKTSGALRSEFIQLAGILDDYNNGITGPGHCSE
jgi:hypothetical protein